MSGHFTCGACGRLATPCRRGQIDPSLRAHRERIDGGKPRARSALGDDASWATPEDGVGTTDLREDDFSRPLPARVGTPDLCEHSSAPSPRCRRDGTPGPAAAPRRDVWRGMNPRRWAIRRG